MQHLLHAPVHLVILEHTSQAEEKYVRNGDQKNVHVVVKNTPFFIKVGLTPTLPGIDFNLVTVEAQLMYDCEGDRFVDFVKNKPLEYKGTINDKADVMTLEIRLKKLSSHLEDMFFKIRLKGVDSYTKEAIPSLSITTQPIKVVSKPEQVARIKEGQSGQKPVNPATRTKKRSLNELMYETMQKIEKQQQEHQALLQQLATSTTTNAAAVPTGTSDKKLKVVDGDPLENALHNLLASYQHTDPTERPIKIRKLVRKAAAKEVDALSEFTNHLQYSLQKDDACTYPSSDDQNFPSSTTKVEATNNISYDELQRIDEFYRDLLFTGNLTPSNSNESLW